METNRSYHAYLVDFGITRVASFDDVSVIDDEIADDNVNSNCINFGNAFQERRGARGYWPPEVLLDSTRTAEYGQSSDVWALCVTLLEMLVNAPAYGINAGLGDIVELFSNRLTIPSVRMVKCEHVQEILLKGLNYDVRQRSTAAEIADQFGMLVADRRQLR